MARPHFPSSAEVAGKEPWGTRGSAMAASFITLAIKWETKPGGFSPLQEFDQAPFSEAVRRGALCLTSENRSLQ